MTFRFILVYKYIFHYQLLLLPFLQYIYPCFSYVYPFHFLVYLLGPISFVHRYYYISRFSKYFFTFILLTVTYYIKQVDDSLVFTFSTLTCSQFTSLFTFQLFHVICVYGNGIWSYHFFSSLILSFV